MLIPFVIITILYFQTTNGAIKCYKCSPTKPQYYTNETTIRLCSDFDYSEKFIVDCPYSTLCMKREFTAKIPVPINATERDCAYQKYVTQNFKNGRWQPEVVVEEPYKEGCATIDDKGFRTSTTNICYCRGDLCNKTTTIHSTIIPIKFLSIAVIIYLFSLYCH